MGNKKIFISIFISESWLLSFEDLVGLPKVVVLSKDWASVVEGFEKIIDSDKTTTDIIAKNNLKGKVDGLEG